MQKLFCNLFIFSFIITILSCVDVQINSLTSTEHHSMSRNKVIIIPIELDKDNLKIDADLKQYDKDLSEIIIDMKLDNYVDFKNLRIELKSVNFFTSSDDEKIKSMKSIYINADQRINQSTFYAPVTLVARNLVLPSISVEEQRKIEDMPSNQKRLFVLPNKQVSSQKISWLVKLSFRDILEKIFMETAPFKYLESDSGKALDNRSRNSLKDETYCRETMKLAQDFIAENFAELGSMSAVQCKLYTVNEGAIFGVNVESSYVDISFYLNKREFSYVKAGDRALFYPSLVKDLLLFTFDKLVNERN